MSRRLLVICSLCACAPVETRVGGARLAAADAVVDAPAGPVIEVGKAPVPASLSGPVRLAIDREVPYHDVVDAVHAVRAAGGKPVMLVTYRDRVYALPDAAPPMPDAIKLSARTTGKACVSPPDSNEATCISRLDQKRIDRAFVRQVLYKAVREYGLTHIRVIVEPDLPWGDAVRAIDGARTCCEAGKNVAVSVEPS